MAPEALFVRGPFRGPSGYAHHAREFVRELANKGVAIRLESVPGWGDGYADPWFESLIEPIDARVALQFCMPHQAKHHPGLIDVNFTMFEATRIPPSWAVLGRLIDWTIVPTEFSREAWIESGVPAERLRVCPLGVRSELYGRTHESWPLTLSSGRSLASYRYRFINVSAWNARKNIGGLIRSWLAATRSTDDAALVIKVGLHGFNRVIAFPRLLADCERESGRALTDAAPIHFLHDVLTDEEMPRLYAAGTHYVSMSHGEGWDLAMMEAVAAGLVPIAPDHSAYRCYLDTAVALLIPSRVVRVPGGVGNEWFNHLEWWDPSESDAAAIIRAVIDDGLEPVASARDNILGTYGWDRSAARLLDVLTEVESISPAS